MTVLIDSWCWIEYFEASEIGSKVKEYISSNKQLYVSVINLAELYKICLNKFSENDANTMINFINERCFILPVDSHISLLASIINSKKKIGLGDSLIYATAEKNNLKLMTGDPHFKNEKNVIYLGK